MRLVTLRSTSQSWNAEGESQLSVEYVVEMEVRRDEADEVGAVESEKEVRREEANELAAVEGCDEADELVIASGNEMDVSRVYDELVAGLYPYM